MRLRFASAAFAVALLAASAVRADDYALDTSHTSIIFGIKHAEMSYTYGRFNKMTGSYSLDADPANSKFQLTIDASSIDTNDAKRDEHLKGADFLDAAQFPVITFESTKIEPVAGGDGSVWNVTGNFTLHGVTKEITLELKKLGEGPGMMGDYRSGFLCQTKLMRSDYGMTKFLPGVGDEVAITISFEGVKQGAAAAN